MPSHYGNDARRSNIAALIGNFTRSAGNVANRASSAHQAGLDRRQQQKQHEDAIKEAKKGRRASILQNLLSTGTQIATPFIQNKITEHSMREGGPFWNYQKKRIDWELDADKALAEVESTLAMNEANLEYALEANLRTIAHGLEMDLESLRADSNQSELDRLMDRMNFFNAVVDTGDARMIEYFFPVGEGEEDPFAPGLIVMSQLAAYAEGPGEGKTNAEVREGFLPFLDIMIQGNELTDAERLQVMAIAPDLMEMMLSQMPSPEDVTRRSGWLRNMVEWTYILVPGARGLASWLQGEVPLGGPFGGRRGTVTDVRDPAPATQLHVGTNGATLGRAAAEKNSIFRPWTQAAVPDWADRSQASFPDWADRPQEREIYRLFPKLKDTSAVPSGSKDAEGDDASILQQYNWMKNAPAAGDGAYTDQQLNTILKWIKGLVRSQEVNH